MSKLRNAKFLQICSNEKTNSFTFWMASRFSANVHFWVNYAFKKQLNTLNTTDTQIKYLSMFQQYTAYNHKV